MDVYRNKEREMILAKKPLIVLEDELWQINQLNRLRKDLRNRKKRLEKVIAVKRFALQKVQEKIAEEIQEIGATKWFSKNLGFVWIASLFLSVVPLIWFGLSTYYKRVSALFYSNRVKAFILFIIVESALDMISLNSGSSLVYWICTTMGFIIFFYLVLKNSPIGEHDG